MVEDLRLDSLEGVGPVTTRKLSDAGVHNVMDLIVRGPVEIAEITGILMLKIFLAKRSSLKQCKSSKDPPPLATIIKSILLQFSL